MTKIHHNATISAAVKSLVQGLRLKLLDTSSRNNLVSFKHSDRARTHIRIVNELIDNLFHQFLDNKSITFRALPRIKEEPIDEQTNSFLSALEVAKITNIDYITAIKNLDEDGSSLHIRKAERILRDEVRHNLNLPVYPIKELPSLIEHAKANKINPNYDLQQSKTVKIKEKSRKEIQTLLLPEAMERKLSVIWEKYKSSLQETGVNTLHCVFGFLEWYENATIERPILAPLLFLPLEIERKLQQGQYRYLVSTTGEEMSVNLTLSERLYQNFCIRLPNIEEEDTPESYFKKTTEEFCVQKPDWRIRQFVTIGHFIFTRLVMYHDLDDKYWPEGKEISNHKVVQDLLAGTESDGPVFAQEYNIDTEWAAKQVPTLVTDADSSQHSAIIDAMNGRNLVIEGPPGTGKSQTITNIIAAALSKGKRVLFIAEKMAALEVTKNRLDKVGLGDFCLELHSTKAKKRDILTTLKQRLELTDKIPQPNQLLAELTEVESLKIQLSTYIDLLNSPYGKSGKTLHEILWGYRRLQSVDLPEADEIDQLKIANPGEITPSTIRKHIAALETLAQVGMRLQCETKQHPWYWVKRVRLSPFEQETIIRLIKSCLADAESLLIFRDTIKKTLKISLPLDFLSLEQSLLFLQSAKLGSPSLIAVRPLLIDTKIRNDVQNWLQESKRADAALKAITQLGAIKVLQNVDLENLIQQFTDIITKFKHPEEQLYSLQKQADQLLSEATDLNTSLDYIHIVVDALFKQKPTLASCRAILTAIDIAMSIDCKAMRILTADILLPDNYKFIQIAAERCPNLKTQKASIETKFIEIVEIDVGIIRKYAMALRNAKVFSFLNTAVRNGKRFYYQIAKLPTKNTKLMAQELFELAEYMEATTQFIANEKVRMIFGHHYWGLETDFESAYSAAKWGEYVRVKLLPSHNEHIVVRNLLLEGNYDLIETLQALGNTPEFIKAKKIFNRDTLPDGNVAETINSFLMMSNNIRQVYTQISKLGIPQTTTCEVFSKVKFFAQEIVSALKRRSAALSSLPEQYRQSIDSASSDLVGELLNTTEPFLDKKLPTQVKDLLFDTDSYAQINCHYTYIEKSLYLIKEINDTLGSLMQYTQADVFSLFGCEKEVSIIKSVFTKLLLFEEQLSMWLDWLSACQHVDSMGVGDFCTLYERNIGTRDPKICYERVFYRSLAEEAFTVYPQLSEFSGLDLQQAGQRFRDIDRRILFLHGQALAAQLCGDQINNGIRQGRRSEYTDKALILSELAKQRKHIPIRTLLSRAGVAIQQMQPCFMMSPISVAQFLEPEKLTFDILIIDEASQMRPEDALCAIARCAQIIVVGDPKQLPPSSFFDRLENSMDEEEKEDSVQSESILDLALSVFRPARRLRWHYRSRHGGLVAFSNKEFYNNELIVFPSPYEKHPDLGVKLIPVQGIYRGKVNIPEVMAIAEHAQDFMHRFLNLSLGIVTMNQAQRDLLSDEMDRVMACDPKCEAYRAKWEGTLEPFFIKNLENVQGDERGVIFISGVYGPKELGQAPLQNFGPINQAQGHRRLNVLFTRAKYQVRFFSSLRPEDIRVSASSSWGVRALRAYLCYALTGRLEEAPQMGREPDSDFEIWVKEQLLLAGYQVDHQVGVSGFYLDLAVRHPDYPGIYLMGIECDGATYHSSRSARDRDRLRQEVLETLGWKIYRVWSTDWFRQPKNELQRMIRAIEMHRHNFKLLDFTQSNVSDRVE